MPDDLDKEARERREALRTAIRSGTHEEVLRHALAACERLDLAEQRAKDALALADAFTTRSQLLARDLNIAHATLDGLHTIATGGHGWETLDFQHLAFQAVKDLRAHAIQMEKLYSSEHDRALTAERRLLKAQQAMQGSER